MINDPQFAGRGELLLTEPLRAFRSWSVLVKMSPRYFSIRDYLDARHAFPADPSTDRLQLHRDLWKVWAMGSNQYRSSSPYHHPHDWDAWVREEEPGEPWPRPHAVEGTPVPGTNDVITNVIINPVNHGQHGPWAQRVHHAACSSSTFSSATHVPDEGCTCGIYSWYRHPDAIREHTSVLTGVISVGGRVLLGSRGIRSSQATIEALTVNDRMEHLLPVDGPTLLTAIRRRTEDPHDPLHGIMVVDSVKELNRAYPPDLATLKNLLGPQFINDLEYGGGHPWASLGTAATGIHLMGGHRAQRYGDRVKDAVARLNERLRHETTTTPPTDPPEKDDPAP